jgi:hypothetical protein
MLILKVVTALIHDVRSILTLAHGGLTYVAFRGGAGLVVLG